LATRSPKRHTPRPALTRERVFRAAMAIADKEGLDAVTMRRLGQELGVEAMSLYHHVRSKDEILDGMADEFVAAIDEPAHPRDWKAAIRERAMAARALVRRHKWAPHLLASPRKLSPRMLHYEDWVLGRLLEGGLSCQMAHSAMHLIGSRTLGFTQELSGVGDDAEAAARKIFGSIDLAEYPAFKAILRGGVHHDEDLEFAFGLDLVLDGLERARDAEARTT
jgi:AcrR family transcriptional regulator